MKSSDKHQLEGLLKARAADLRHTRGQRRRRPVADPPQPQVAPPQTGEETAATGRACADCGAVIASRRLRALPRVTRCLDCQRAAEHATAPS